MHRSMLAIVTCASLLIASTLLPAHAYTHSKAFHHGCGVCSIAQHMPAALTAAPAPVYVDGSYGCAAPADEHPRAKRLGAAVSARAPPVSAERFPTRLNLNL